MAIVIFLLICSTVFPVGSYRGDCDDGLTDSYWRPFPEVELEIQAAPYTVFIQSPDTLDKFNMCTAALISVRGVQYLLATARCVYALIKDTEITYAYAGTNRQPTAADHLRRVVPSIKFHPNYTDGLYYNDIAILSLDTGFPLSQNITPIDLPPQGLEAKDGDKLFLSQWEEFDDDPPAWKLMGYEIEVSTNEYCNRIGTNSFEIVPTQFCSYDSDIVYEGGRNAPAVTTYMDKKVLTGHVTWEKVCPFDGRYPVVYTKISEYVDWIEQTTMDMNMNHGYYYEY